MARHALLVGVADFDDPRLNRLNAPLADVEKLAELLRDPARGAFDTVKTVTSGDFLETRTAILAALLRGRVPDDLVLLLLFPAMASWRRAASSTSRPRRSTWTCPWMAASLPPTCGPG